jgi:hypothetical protein
MGPGDRKQYDWADLNQLPTESTVVTGAPVTSPTPTHSPSRPAKGPEALENPDKPGVVNAPPAPDDGKSTGGKENK